MNDKWPRLLHDYLPRIGVYAAAGDRSNFIFQKQNPLSSERNHTSYIMNGSNDIGAYTNEDVEVRLTQLETPASVILVGRPRSGSTHFYMDMLEGSNGNHVDVLNLTVCGDGSDYLFADRSARYLTANMYNAQLWLVSRDFPEP